MTDDLIGSSLEGRTAIVTGGSRGIGKAIASAYVALGASVMICSRKAEACEEAAAEIGGSVAWEAAHVAVPDDIDRVIESTIDRFGSLDILVNNAATNPYAGPTIDVDVERWNKTIEVNLTAPLLWSQRAWNASMKEHGGVILNIASVGALLTSPLLGTYDVTKSALLHLTTQLAAELAPGVRVNALAPGLIKTDFARALWEGEGGDQVASSYPLRRLGTVEDVAAAAVYMTSDTSGWVTGQHLVLDGGGMVGFSSLG
jgi:NAD(P)-dependent dehydrogenase (short-subunit alcohol dehydrogenase family)